MATRFRAFRFGFCCTAHSCVKQHISGMPCLEQSAIASVREGCKALLTHWEAGRHHDTCYVVQRYTNTVNIPARLHLNLQHMIERVMYYTACTSVVRLFWRNVPSGGMEGTAVRAYSAPRNMMHIPLMSIHLLCLADLVAGGWSRCQPRRLRLRLHC